MENDDFDWVTAQSGCTAEMMYQRLLTGVKHDVERRNRVGTNGGTSFEVHEDDDGKFEVVRVVNAGSDNAKVLAAVMFERTGSRIHVRGDEIDVEFTTIITLDASGACRFVVGEVEYSDWQVRRMALAELFFDEETE